MPWLGKGNVFCSQLCHGLAVWPWISPFSLVRKKPIRVMPQNHFRFAQTFDSMWDVWFKVLVLTHSNNAWSHPKEHVSLFYTGNWRSLSYQHFCPSPVPCFYHRVFGLKPIVPSVNVSASLRHLPGGFLGLRLPFRSVMWETRLSWYFPLLKMECIQPRAPSY